MIITVGGMIGSGKSTLGKGIAKRFNIDYISIGDIMRRMAEEMNMTLNQFSEYAETHPEIDKKIDHLQKKMIKKAKNCVVDGRLSAYFATNPDLRIWLNAPLKVRAKRVASRDNISVKDAIDRIIERERSERKRYKSIYNIDLDDLSIYDLVINTGIFDVDATINIASNAIENLNRNRYR